VNGRAGGVLASMSAGLRGIALQAEPVRDPALSGNVGPVKLLAFVASLVHSRAWPASVVAVVVVLRTPIGLAVT